MKKSVSEQMDDGLDELELLVTGELPPTFRRDFLEEHFNLPSNPFPPSGIADQSGEIPPLQRELFDEILNFLRQTYSTKRRRMLVIRGDYGTGKTHTLHFIEQVVNNRMSKGDRAARAIYVERPRIEAQELNRAILRSLGYDSVRKYTWFAIRIFLIEHLTENTDALRDLASKLDRTHGKKRNPQQPTLWSKDELMNLLPFGELFSAENLADYRIFLKQLEANGWTRDDIRPILINCLLEAAGGEKPTDLAQLFVALLLAPDEASFASWEVLLGMSKPRATSSLRTSVFLKFLLRLMEINGIAYVYLLLDEFEEVSQGTLLTARQRQDYLYTVREVLNNIHSGLSIIMAVSPAGWDAIVTIGTPLADVNDHVIDLKRLGIDELVTLVQTYFNWERRATKYAETNIEDISPLSRELLEYVLAYLPRGIQPTPRNLIQFLHVLFDYVETHRIGSLDTNLLNQLLEGFASIKSSTGGRQPKGR